MEKITLLDIKTKKCSKCGEIKELGEFYKRKSSKDGYGCECKSCRNIINKIWTKNNLEKVRGYGKKYYKNNLEKVKESSFLLYKNNPEKAKEYNRLWSKKNPERRKEIRKKWRKNNLEKVRESSRIYTKKYNILNPEKAKESRRISNKKCRKNNLHYKIKHNVSSLILVRLKSRLLSKEGKSTFDFLPYTIDDLIKHLESQFESWMNWQNYGKGEGRWTIDHIIPDSSFNYTSVEDEEFQKCWALSNLQPLEWMENIKKSNKIIY